MVARPAARCPRAGSPRNSPAARNRPNGLRSSCGSSGSVGGRGRQGGSTIRRHIYKVPDQRHVVEPWPPLPLIPDKSVEREQAAWRSALDVGGDCLVAGVLALPVGGGLVAGTGYVGFELAIAGQDLRQLVARGTVGCMHTQQERFAFDIQCGHGLPFGRLGCHQHLLADRKRLGQGPAHALTARGGAPAGVGATLAQLSRTCVSSLATSSSVCRSLRRLACTRRRLMYSYKESSRSTSCSSTLRSRLSRRPPRMSMQREILSPLAATSPRCICPRACTMRSRAPSMSSVIRACGLAPSTPPLERTC